MTTLHFLIQDADKKFVSNKLLNGHLWTIHSWCSMGVTQGFELHLTADEWVFRTFTDSVRGTQSIIKRTKDLQIISDIIDSFEPTNPECLQKMKEHGGKLN